MRYRFLSFLLLISIGCQCQIDTETLRINYQNTDVSLLQVFQDLEETYGITISYSTNSIFHEEVSVHFENENLEDVLAFLLKDKKIECKLISNNILLRKTDEYIENINEQEYQNALHLKGKVVTANERNSLGLATVAILGTSVGTYSDDEGYFDLEIPQEHADKEMVVSFVGYESMRYALKEEGESYLLVAMSESLQLVEEVEIVNREKPIRISNSNNSLGLNSKQIKDRTSGIVGSNVNRNIQLLPGITAHNDNSSDIQVRGSSSDATLIILDGIPIYRSSHYYGIFSTINSSYVDSINVYKNNFPVNFSGKTGGVVEMLSEQSNNNKLNAEIDLNLLTSETKLSLPISKQSRILLSGKTTWRKVNNSNFNTKGNRERGNKKIETFKEKFDNNNSSPGVRFVDLHGKYQWRNTSKSFLSLNMFYSKEDIDNAYETEISNTQNNSLNVRVAEVENWESLGGSLLGKRAFSERWEYSTRTYFSRFNQIGRNGIQIDIMPQPGNPSPSINLSAFQSNRLINIGHNSEFRYREDIFDFVIGTEYSRNRLDYLFSENQERVFGGAETVNQLSLYSAINKTIFDRVNLNIGLRGNYFNELNKVFLSPRLLINYEANEQLTFKSSFSIYQQVVRQLYFEYRAVPMELWLSSVRNEIPVLQSYNFMVGSTFRNSYFSLDVEGYYKQLVGVLEYASLNPELANNNPDNLQDYRLFSGTGRVYGLDLILSSGYQNYDTYLSYTLSKSEEKYKQINKNKFYPSEIDRRHQFKWVNSYSFEKWRFGVNGIYSSGRPYTNITSTGANQDIRETSPEKRFTRLPAYRRVDVSASYLVAIKSINAELSLSVFNLFNTENVKYVQSVVAEVSENNLPFTSVVGGENSLLNRTFNFGVKVYLGQ